MAWLWIKDLLKWILCKEEMEASLRLHNRIGEVMAWCNEFPQMMDALEWVIAQDDQTRILVWRDKMREKYREVKDASANG